MSGCSERVVMSAKFEMFVISGAVESKKACELAREWKSASPATRKAACKRQGESFSVSISGSRSEFIFSVDGTVKTINNIQQRPARKSNQPMHLVVDESRQVVGICKGRVIYR